MRRWTSHRAAPWWALMVVLAWVRPASAQQAPRGGMEDERARAAHLLSRATWGARPADVAAALSLGRTQWLERQLRPERIADNGLTERLAVFPTTALTMSELLRDYTPQPAQQQQRAALQAMDSAGRARALAQQEAQMTAEERRERQMRNPQRIAQDLVGAKITRAVYTERQLEDVMADFWFNHFNVFFGKGQDRYFVGDYEKTAIRPHVFGKFEDMLLATAQHPAMLFYLDNAQSVYVDTMRVQPTGDANVEQLARRIRAMTQVQKEDLVRSGRITREMLRQLESGIPPQDMMRPQQQRAQNRGLNENYARELLELHTLGVDGGYTQQDVINVARAFTGWGFERPGARQQQQRPARPLGRAGLGRGLGGMQQQDAPIYGKGDVPFVFRPQLHDRSEKIVLGRVLPANRGLEDGADVMHMLTRHPSTAKHIATKLVERFVSDDPPADLVAHIAAVFQKTEGDLREVTRALFTADAFYRAEYRGAKVKTPYELVVSALRVTNATVGPSRRVMETLRTMGHLPYSEPTPTGFPAMSEDWVNTGAMLNRMTFGVDLAANRVDGVRVDAAGLVEQTAAARRGNAPASVPLDAMLATLMPNTETTRLATKIRAELEAQPAEAPRQRSARALGLALGSPEFQRR